MKPDAIYQRKLDALRTDLGPSYTTIPTVAKFLHVKEETLRNDPTFPRVSFGSRVKVSIDSLAQWLTDKEVKGVRA